MVQKPQQSYSKRAEDTSYQKGRWATAGSSHGDEPTTQLVATARIRPTQTTLQNFTISSFKSLDREQLMEAKLTRRDNTLHFTHARKGLRVWANPLHIWWPRVKRKLRDLTALALVLWKAERPAPWDSAEDYYTTECVKCFFMHCRSPHTHAYLQKICRPQAPVPRGLKKSLKKAPKMSSRSRSPPETMEAEEELACPLSPDVVGACCLIDGGQRCRHPATSATFNKRLVKTSLQRRRQLIPDPEVSQFSS